MCDQRYKQNNCYYYKLIDGYKQQSLYLELQGYCNNLKQKEFQQWTIQTIYMNTLYEDLLDPEQQPSEIPIILRAIYKTQCVLILLYQNQVAQMPLRLNDNLEDKINYMLTNITQVQSDYKQAQQMIQQTQEIKTIKLILWIDLLISIITIILILFKIKIRKIN